VEDIGAWVGDEERVDAGLGRGSRDRAEVPGPFDRDCDGYERLRRRVESLECGGRPADECKQIVRASFGQARECAGPQVDDGGAAALGRRDEIAVATAG
jgi:hypothetical protein